MTQRLPKARRSKTRIVGLMDGWILYFVNIWIINFTILYMNEKTVDLHIEELVKDFTVMSNGQIIALQLKHFQYEMTIYNEVTNYIKSKDKQQKKNSFK